MVRRLLCLGVAAALLGGCSSPRPALPFLRTSPAPGTLRVALGGVPASLDPARQRDPWERGVAAFYTEALLRPRADLGDVEPAAASSYDVSPDGRVYTFHLRPDGRFSDGAPVTAAAFALAWRRLIDPRVGSPHADMFATAVAGGAYAEALDPEDPAAPIDQALDRLGLAAPDPLTFQVTLAQPSLWFKWLATVWAGAPVEPAVVDRLGGAWADSPASLAGNGPFRVAAIGGGVITLEPNPYYRSRPRLARVEAVEAGGAAAVDAFRAGQLDLAAVPAGQAAAVLGDSTLRPALRRVPQLTTAWLVFNCYRSALGSAGVREALALALDRQAYVDAVAGGEAVPDSQLLPVGVPGRLEQAGQAFDPEAARRQLAGAGGAGRLSGLHVLVESTPTGKAFGAYVHDQLAGHLGVQVGVEAVDAKTYATRIANRQFDLAGPQRWTADYPDPQDWLDLFTTGTGLNAGRWQDPVYDDLVRLGDGGLDPAGRLRAYDQAQLELDGQAPAAFLGQDVAWVLISERIQGLQVTPSDPAPVLGTLALSSLAIGR